MGSVNIQNVTGQSGTILVLYGGDRERNYFKAKLADLCPNSEVFSVCVEVKEETMLPVFEECCRLIENHNISIVINRLVAKVPFFLCFLNKKIVQLLS